MSSLIEIHILGHRIETDEEARRVYTLIAHPWYCVMCHHPVYEGNAVLKDEGDMIVFYCPRCLQPVGARGGF